MAPHSYRGTLPACLFWQPVKPLGNHSTCTRGSHKHHKTLHFPSLCKQMVASQDVILPPCPTVRCIRRRSSFIPATACQWHRDLLTEGAGTSWDPSYKGSEEANDDYFSLLRDFGRVAELGCFTAFCERDQMWSGCCTPL